MTRMCLNWKVLGGLAATGLGISLFAPQLLSASLPLLVAAACPLSMLAMMWAMRGMQGGGCARSWRERGRASRRSQAR